MPSDLFSVFCSVKKSSPVFKLAHPLGGLLSHGKVPSASYLSIFPPFMVSLKWVSQQSLLSTLDKAAAMPPSAITVCALPRRDLHISPVEAPWAEDSMAAEDRPLRPR